MKVAISRSGELISPAFEHSGSLSVFTIEDGKIVGQTDFTLRSPEVLDRIRLLGDQDVDTLICGGIQHGLEKILRARGVHTISWVSGPVVDILELFVRGLLVERPERAPGIADVLPPDDKAES